MDSFLCRWARGWGGDTRRIMTQKHTFARLTDRFDISTMTDSSSSSRLVSQTTISVGYVSTGIPRDER